VWAPDRHHNILSLLARRGKVSNDLLVQELQVSRETIRRDILELEASGQLKRVHGGVVAVEATPEAPFNVRIQSSAIEKQRIGAAAAKLIEPGMLCAIDTGTTTLAFAEALAAIPNVSVITNSLAVATTIRSAQREASIILLGGQLDYDVPGAFGEQAVALMQQFVPDVAILSPVAINSTHGATSYALAEAELARTMIDRASRVIMLADHAKIGGMSRVRMCACDEIDVLVTDRESPSEEIERLRRRGIDEIVLA
jgi:DeoR family transcriptional regulator, fructose operon transcriptional repressor